MSTTGSASATPGTHQGAEVVHLSLPTFAPARNDQNRRESLAESSTSGSRWSTGNRRSRSPSNSGASSVNLNGGNEIDHRPAPSTLPRRNHNRSSGGFLLEPSTHSSRLSRAILSRSQADVKGKRKSDLSEISVSKRRNRQSLLNRDPPGQGSPLSTELSREQDNQDNREEDGFGKDGSIRGQSGPQNGLSATPGSQRSVVASLGFDSDSAQIVDMALKLSEGRRRQASGKRFVSGETHLKRAISTTTSHQLRTPTKTLNQYATLPATGTGSPLPDISLLNGSKDEGDDSMHIDDPFSSPGLKRLVSGAEKEVDISRATAARVEKVKVYMEIAYEHRRLLSHLPPIRGPAFRYGSPDDGSDSKIYNPLQYARNRKLRIREKSAIHAEIEGWHDIEKVRTWVDAVINSHTETRHDPLECVRLPPLSLKEDDQDGDGSTSFEASPKSVKQQQVKPRRPKSDWVTHPGDLIADAFWLEQGLNKTKIQDRDNNPIYPPDTPFKFSGWRSRVPVNIPERFQQLTPPPETKIWSEKVPPLPSAPELPTFQSARRAEKKDSQSRKVPTTKTPLSKTTNGQSRRKTNFWQSSSESESESDSESNASLKDPLEEEVSRGRRRTSKEFDLPDGDPFERPASSKPKGSLKKQDGDHNEFSFPGQNSNRSSIDNSRLMNYLKRNSTSKHSSHERGRSRGDTKGRGLLHKSKDSGNDHRPARTSIEDDNAQSVSPVHYGLPSIAIDLDTPVSRSPSPTKKAKPGLLNSLRDRSKHSVRDKVETTDFAKRQDGSHSRGTSVDIKANEGSTPTSRGTSPHTRGPSPFSRLRRESTHKEDLSASPIEKQTSILTKSSTRPWSMQVQEPSRIRGIFKGGRIAELVGNEVSRVGDFIWKRDIPPAYRRQMSESESSFRTFDSSATEEDVQNNSNTTKPGPDGRGSMSTLSGIGGRPSQDSPRNNEKPMLHNPNLPSFTSPFQRDREKQDKQQDLLAPSSPEDHISRQAAQHRSASKSPRLDRLTLPKLDTGAPRSVGLIERKNSYGFGAELKRSQSASRSFNDIINTKPSKSASARNSTAGLSSRLRQSVAESIQTDGVTSVSRHDIHRLRSLLLISAVKAKKITASHEQIPTEPSRVLLDTVTRSGGATNASSIMHARRRDAPILAARNLIGQLTSHTDKINDQLHVFSDTTVGQLHQRIQELEDQIENTITPRVRIAADSAGELSVKLTTTSTQAVKSLQDTISEAFRLRRRGPFRWVRLLWFRVVELSVVGLLWFIWAIVSLIRLFIGVFKGVGKTTRWLLWID